MKKNFILIENLIPAAAREYLRGNFEMHTGRCEITVMRSNDSQWYHVN